MWFATISDHSFADWLVVDSWRRDADTHRHTVWQQEPLIPIQDEWHWLRSSFRKTLIDGHVTNGLGICGFLFVSNNDHASILHGFRDMRHQKIGDLGSGVWPFEVTWRHRSRDRLIRQFNYHEYPP